MSGSLNLLKLCVGPSNVEDLAKRIEQNVLLPRKQGLDIENIHTTRMVPNRVEELLDGGSIYWIIKGLLCVRQPLLDIRKFTDDDGIKRCHLVFEPTLIRVEPRPMRAFQGWRYLKGEDAPKDLFFGENDNSLPAPIAIAVREYGVIS